MKKTCLIQQEAGIGDIFFSQGICKQFENNGYQIIWPVARSILELTKYLKTGPNVTFVCTDDDFEHKDVFKLLYERKQIAVSKKNDETILFLPLGYSSHMVEPFTRQVMQAKYKICSLNYTSWKNSFDFNRNHEKENKLFYDVLGLKDDEDYCLVNEQYVTPPDIHRKNLSRFYSTFGDTKFIHMKIYDEFSLFDWCKVFENMKSIITVDTSLMYILEKLNLKNKTNFLCVTRSPHTAEDITDLFSIKWRYIHA